MNNTLANGLTLLAFLSNTADAYTVTDLAKHLDLPKSHIHRLLQTLVEQGYAIQDEDRRYRIGMQPLVISKALLANHPMRHHARVHLHRVSQTLGMDALIAIPHRDGTGLVIVAEYPGGEQGDPATAIGNRLNFPGTAIGALFSVLVPDFSTAPPLPLAQRRSIIRDDQAIKDPTLTVGVNGIATAIRDASGHVIGAMGCSAPCAYFNAKLEEVRAMQRKACAAISEALSLRPTA